MVEDVIRGHIYTLRGSDQMVLALGDVFGGDRRIPDVVVAPIGIDIERSGASTLDIVAAPDVSTVRRAFAAAVWAAVAIPVTYLGDHVGQLNDDSLLEAATEVQIGMVDPSVRPRQELVGSVQADGQPLPWHNVVCGAMQPYWDGTIADSMVPVVALPPAVVLLEDDVDVVVSRQKRGVFARAAELFGVDLRAVTAELRDSVLVYRNATIETAESIVAPSIGNAMKPFIHNIVDLSISVTAVRSSRLGWPSFQTSTFWPGSSTVHGYSQYVEALTLPAVLNPDSTLEIVRLSASANSNLAMCA